MAIINCNAEVKRIIYTDGKSTGMKSMGKYDGYWTALGENSKLLEPGAFGKTFILKITKPDVDIRDGDEVIIEEKTYSVSGVSNKKMGKLCLTTALLNLNQEDATS